MKAKNIPFLVLLLVSLYPVFQRFSKPETPREIERADSLLPAAARDVLLLTADFSEHPGDVLDFANLAVVSEIDESLGEMDGLRRSSSILTAPVIRAEQDEILVVPFIAEQWLQRKGQ